MADRELFVSAWVINEHGQKIPLEVANISKIASDTRGHVSRFTVDVTRA